MAMNTAPSRTTGDARRTVAGVFDGPNHAEMALNELKNAGFTPDQVSVVAKDTRETRQMAENTGMGAEGAVTGAVLGGLTGGILGWLVGVGALAIPGIGPIVAAGAIATTLGGAAVGAAAGGLLGALVDAGIPEEDARGYESSVREGRILLTVNAMSDDQARKAQQIFDRHGGSDVRGYGYDSDMSRSGGASETAAVAGGSAVGGAAGAVVGGIVAGPPGAVAGAVIGGSTGAVTGDAVDDSDEPATTSRRTRRA